jgi:peptidoglycan/LPS O-acetylase OafA/YrhL
MPFSLRPFKKLRWKWVGITLFLYTVFYVVPLFMVGDMPPSEVAEIFAGVWLFAGIALIAAIAGFLSEGVTIWEPAIAGIALYALCFIAESILSAKIALLQHIAPPVVTLAVVFILSLYGAKWGEAAQELWRKKFPR